MYNVAELLMGGYVSAVSISIILVVSFDSYLVCKLENTSRALSGWLFSGWRRIGQTGVAQDQGPCHGRKVVPVQEGHRNTTAMAFKRNQALSYFSIAERPHVPLE